MFLMMYSYEIVNLWLLYTVIRRFPVKFFKQAIFLTLFTPRDTENL